jgi:hypothetical protein
MTALLLLMGLLSGGCTSIRDRATVQTTANYWPLDSLAMSYGDPVAVSPIHDHPVRWLGFALHPVGVVMDFAVNRPLYAVASILPGLFGFTVEDAGHQAQRSGQAYR